MTFINIVVYLLLNLLFFLFWVSAYFLQSFVSEGKTVLMTSHYMSELELTVDHLVGISNGKIVIDAPTKDILKQFGSFEEAYFKAPEGKEGE